MNDPATHKKRLRAEMRRRRAAIPAADRQAAAERLAAHLLAHPLVEPLAPGPVLVPVAHRSEIGTAPLARRLEDAGWTLVRPRSDPARTHLDAVPWPNGRPLVPGHAGIPEPPPDAGTLPPEKLRLVLVPALAFGPDGHRIGSGQGFFDRFLAPLEARAERPVTLGIGYALQLVDDLPHEPHDVPLDGLQLEARAIRCRPEDRTAPR